jgi:hypothetical protein
VHGKRPVRRTELELAMHITCETCGSDCNERDELDKAEREIARLMLARDCRLCANYTTKSGGCVALVQCVDGQQYKATPPRQYWKSGKALGPEEGAVSLAVLLVPRFRDPDGKPTCCADHPSGKTCRFLGSRYFGSVDVCMLGEQRDLAPRTHDYQRPDARCEVWAGHAASAGVTGRG